MIFLTGFQIAELRKVPTTKITHAILEESPVTPLVLKVTECYPDGSNSEYEVSQEGKRRNAA